ncbi:Crp/Fnr family transcriptional regulator [Streptomyces sp. VNUA116]|uniref:Crp/Fnr family transcriptional regulator n=1 Tax=Streptomyces sp. VNUA116 TaxID=3062449 RepID=UPI0026770CF1|nr:Crp/Fnr family transcriptional regulator [Streptomyces sp. VNUA116]WKU47029.1 Crp/Fnr family transcriptional regulator [Streptomyces sp. VNUA116]
MNFREIVSDQAWKDLIQRSQRRLYRRGTILLRQGESATSVIALTEGTVKVDQAAESGDALTLTLRGPGEVLGEMGAILDRPRSATVRSVSACVGYVMPAHAFRGYLDRHQLATSVYKLAVDRMQEIERLRTDLASLAPAARVARVVAHLAQEVGRPDNDGVLVELGMPREELAAMAAMSRSAAVPVLSQLQAAGILSLSRGRITVKDVDGLNAAAMRSMEPPDM